ncbi:hypothetical protein D9757_003496 [Collybiopsis confluens]|uniref:SET domain-containing protein n=1 Tax=Collybiopsis confluens TaxID=2823264 RepID=A0A8H5HTW7_9AGAR|nr:hypothetical protein D9757_003496 [Collybiopsis confluens]
MTDTLLSWCSLHGIEIDSRLHILPDETGIAVYSGSEPIEPFQTLVRIRKNSVISVKSCSASEFIESSPYGHQAQLALAMALLVEIQLGPKSKWYGYLQSLPTIVDLAIFWHLDDDGREALQWLKGSEVEQLLLGPLGIPLINDLKQYYNHTVLPTLNRLSSKENFQGLPESTLEQFLHAYSLVSSRAFLVDAYHGLSMVPVADAFNHTYDHHVHLETEFEVCPECGSLQQCPHDRDADIHLDSDAISKYPESEDTYDMVSSSHIAPHSQVFNTYGETLTNAQLLVQYGFALDVNENDHISWHFDDLQGFLESRQGSPMMASGLSWEILVKSFSSEAFSDSELLYDPDTSNTTEAFRINCDGKLSWQLWLLIASSQCIHLFPTAELGPLLEQLGRYQILVENNKSDRHGPLDDLALLLARTKSTTVALCQHRKARIGVAAHLQNLGDLVDASLLSFISVQHSHVFAQDLQPSQKRTRLALLQVITELAILDSCKASWTEFSRPSNL